MAPAVAARPARCLTDGAGGPGRRPTADATRSARRAASGLPVVVSAHPLRALRQGAHGQRGAHGAAHAAGPGHPRPDASRRLRGQGIPSCGGSRARAGAARTTKVCPSSCAGGCHANRQTPNGSPFNLRWRAGTIPPRPFVSNLGCGGSTIMVQHRPGARSSAIRAKQRRHLPSWVTASRLHFSPPVPERWRPCGREEDD